MSSEIPSFIKSLSLIIYVPFLSCYFIRLFACLSGLFYFVLFHFIFCLFVCLFLFLFLISQSN